MSPKYVRGREMMIGATKGMLLVSFDEQGSLVREHHLWSIRGA
jgi:hypothetical protein